MSLLFPKPEPTVKKPRRALKRSRLRMNPEQARERGIVTFWRQVVRALVESRDAGRCRICGEVYPAVEMHHAVYLSRGGPDDPANALMLCQFHHRAVHRRDAVCPTPLPGRRMAVVVTVESRGYGVRDYVTEEPVPASMVTNRETLWLVSKRVESDGSVRVCYRSA